MTKILIDRAVVEQALHVATAAGYPVALIAALKAALAEPQEPQGPPYPGWKMGCRVCGAHGAMGYVCPRSDCPTRVTCGGAA